MKSFSRSGNQIAATAVNKALRGRDGDDDWIRQNFSNLVEHVQIDAYSEYLAAEQIAGQQSARPDLSAPDRRTRHSGANGRGVGPIFLRP